MGHQTVHSVHFYVAFSEGETFCHSPKRLLQSQLLHNDWNLVLVSVIVQSYTVYKVGGKPAVSCDWDETSRWTEWTFWENICNFSIIHRLPLKYIFIAWSYCCIGDLWDNVVAVKLRCVETVPIWVWPSFCKQWMRLFEHSCRLMTQYCHLVETRKTYSSTQSNQRFNI